jgi:hypothetical protein
MQEANRIYNNNLTIVQQHIFNNDYNYIEKNLYLHIEEVRDINETYINYFCDEIINYSIKYSHYKILKNILYNPNVNVNLNDLLLKNSKKIRVVEIILEHPNYKPDYVLIQQHIYRLCKDNSIETIKLLFEKKIISPLGFPISQLIEDEREHIMDILLKDSRMKDYPFKNYHFEYQNKPKIQKTLKDYYIKFTFRKLNKIVCMTRIKKFMLRYVILHPKSIHVNNLVNNF